MKLNYVSVLKEYKTRSRNDGYYIRGEFQSPPSNHAINQFLLVWTSTPAYRKLCLQPQISNNEIIIPLPDEENIAAAIDAIRSLVSRIKEPNIGHEDPYFLVDINKAII